MGDLSYLPALAQARLLSRDEERVLALKIKLNDTEAYHALVVANTRLVISIAQKYRNIPLPDAIGDGLLGLMTAAKRYDPERGTRFSTYATLWIRQAILKSRMTYPMIRIPSGKFEEINRLETIASTLGPNPSDEDIAELASKKGKTYSAAQVREYLNEGRRSNPTSLDALTEYVEFGTFPQEKMKLDVPIGKALKMLKPKAQYVIMMSYFADPPKQLDEIGKELGISPERARQIKIASLKKMSNSVPLQKFINDISDVME